MKNQLTGSLLSIAKKVFTAATFAFFLAITTMPARAFANETKVQSESPVEVRYLGLVDSRPVFQVNIDNATEDDVYFSLKDEDGNVIYSERFKDRKLSRKFQLNAFDTNNMKVIMSLFSRNDKKSQTFEISNVTTVVEDVVVTKVR